MTNPFAILAAVAASTDTVAVAASNKMLASAEKSAADAADIIGSPELLSRYVVAKATNRALAALVKAETERLVAEAESSK